jgi:hypothetical protein
MQESATEMGFAMDVLEARGLLDMDGRRRMRWRRLMCAR